MKRIAGIPLVILMNLGSNPIVSFFKNRIISDSGIFEAETCINSLITSLSAIDLYPIGDAAMNAFSTRILADGGTFEAYNCGIIAVQSLANIDH